ncbi:SpoIIE family protein phosphatase [Paractinoplanes hotanensis]|uniref:Serine/threonine-protein phosphatase n=1 Tax=Paractinoplanes hotanensis TaxID=2906497 RepID=A0ABT0Y561_9ACTN|nr:SpoIIE family protein phosphatase [Actinoplanes hotanensis]MCM4081179.1 serine/threonine-protein phosphatase [Actinoplanes hotanensis]
MLLYTDRVTETRLGDGRQFGVDALIELAECHAGSGFPPAETLGLMAHDIGDSRRSPSVDDTTMMMVERSRAERAGSPLGLGRLGEKRRDEPATRLRWKAERDFDEAVRSPWRATSRGRPGG